LRFALQKLLKAKTSDFPVEPRLNEQLPSEGGGPSRKRTPPLYSGVENFYLIFSHQGAMLGIRRTASDMERLTDAARRYFVSGTMSFPAAALIVSGRKSAV